MFEIGVLRGRWAQTKKEQDKGNWAKENEKQRGETNAEIFTTALSRIDRRLHVPVHYAPCLPLEACLRKRWSYTERKRRFVLMNWCCQVTCPNWPGNEWIQWSAATWQLKVMRWVRVHKPKHFPQIPLFTQTHIPSLFRTVSPSSQTKLQRPICPGNTYTSMLEMQCCEAGCRVLPAG